MTSSLTKTLLSLDLFGKPIQLGFDKKGSTHNTITGGVVSIIVRIVLLLYTIDLGNKWWNFLDDKINSFEALTDKSILNQTLSL